MCDERNGGEGGEGGEGASCSNADSDWVNCPVCRSNVRGDDRIINSHLGICLSRLLNCVFMLELSFCIFD